MKKRFIYWIFLFVSVLVANVVLPFLIKNESMHFILRVFGVILVLFGIILNVLAGKTLKIYAHKHQKQGFSSPDKFTNAGIFGCMRHPGQFGNILLMFGVAFLSAKILAILYAGWVGMFGLLFILFVEEKEAIVKYSEDYCHYIVSIPPFRISMECLKNGFKAIF